MVKVDTFQEKNCSRLANVAALTSAEIHSPPQVVQVRLPDLDVVCGLNETCIQGLLKNICTKRKVKQNVATVPPEGRRF